MGQPLQLHEDRLFPSDPAQRAVARRLYAEVKDLPIVSPHGHTDPAWFAEDAPFGDPATLFIIPDHYLFRMLYSQGVALEDLGVPRSDGGPVETDGRTIWRRFAEHYHLFRGTPSRLWFDHALSVVLGIEEKLTPESAERIYDRLSERLRDDDTRPRALFERFNIEVLATTESPLDDLAHHQAIRASNWAGKVITAFRPDPVVDPDFEGFRTNLEDLAALTGEDCLTWEGYLAALRQRRTSFTTKETETPKCAAAARREPPPSTNRATRSRRSSE